MTWVNPLCILRHLFRLKLNILGSLFPNHQNCDSVPLIWLLWTLFWGRLAYDLQSCRPSVWLLWSCHLVQLVQPNVSCWPSVSFPSPPAFYLSDMWGELHIYTENRGTIPHYTVRLSLCFVTGFHHIIIVFIFNFISLLLLNLRKSKLNLSFGCHYSSF